MAYDDIAYHKQNPYPGKVFNQPEGDDVYAGVKIDYSGKDVTPENFLAVLQGNKTAVLGGNGRVLKSTKHDHIFVYFSDHGATGLISFPTGLLTVKDLNDALRSMHKQKLFKQMVFYLEACESGSMFNVILSNTTNVYAVTAANEHESSWGCYCDNDMKLPCMGDEFSVNWMDDSDKEDLTLETLKTQFTIVRNETTKSHVMKYGDFGIAEEYVADFQGWDKGPKRNYTKKIMQPYGLWDSRDVHLLYLKIQLEEITNPIHNQRIYYKLITMQKKRVYFDNFMINIVEKIVHDEEKERWILNNHPHKITKLGCHNDIVKWFNQRCLHFSRNPYALKYVYVLTNLCEQGYKKSSIIAVLSHSCQRNVIHNIQ